MQPKLVRARLGVKPSGLTKPGHTLEQQETSSLSTTTMRQSITFCINFVPPFIIIAHLEKRGFAGDISTFAWVQIPPKALLRPHGITTN
jgi:hypothetical protein